MLDQLDFVTVVSEGSDLIELAWGEGLFHQQQEVKGRSTEGQLRGEFPDPGEARLSRREAVRSDDQQDLESAIDYGEETVVLHTPSHRQRLRNPCGRSRRGTTLYDLASLTNVIGTTSVILTLVRDGQLSLDDPITEER